MPAPRSRPAAQASASPRRGRPGNGDPAGAPAKLLPGTIPTPRRLPRCCPPRLPVTAATEMPPCAARAATSNQSTAPPGSPAPTAATVTAAVAPTWRASVCASPRQPPLRHRRPPCLAGPSLLPLLRNPRRPLSLLVGKSLPPLRNPRQPLCLPLIPRLLLVPCAVKAATSGRWPARRGMPVLTAPRKGAGRSMLTMLASGSA